MSDVWFGKPDECPIGMTPFWDSREPEKDSVTYDTFCDFIERQASWVAQVVKDKQGDYGPKAVTRSPISPEIGLLTRMSDKLFRIENLLQRGEDRAVDEAIEDTLEDIAGYALLWLAYRAGQLNYAPEG